MVYGFAQLRHTDERLDALEQEARILLDGQGAIRPSREALQAWFKLEALEDRLDRLEAR